MQNTAHVEGDMLVIDAVIEAPRTRVYEAFVNPNDLTQWFHATEGWTTPFAEVDLRLGGTLRIAFQSPDRKHDFVLEGTFTKVIDGWSLAYDMGPDRSVTIDLADDGELTLVRLAFTLEHENTTEQQCEGWTAMLENLNDYLAV